MKSLRHKIALFVGFSSVLALLAGVAITVLHYELRVRRQSSAELRAMSKSLPIKIENVGTGLSSLLRLNLHSAEFADRLRARDVWTLTTDLAKILSAEHLEYAEVTDGSGLVLLNLADSLKAATKSANPLVSQALRDGSSVHGVLECHDELFIVATAALQDGKKPIAAITIGKAIDRELLSRFGSTSGVHIAIWTGVRQNALVALGEKSLPSIAAVLSEAERDKLFGGELVAKTLKTEDNTYQATLFVHDMMGNPGRFFCAAYRSMEFLTAAGTLTLIHIAALFLLVIIAAAQFAWWISRRVTNPLVKLAATAKRMAALDFTERIPAEGKDEISALARSFNHLAVELQHNIIQKDKYAAELADLNENLERKVSARTEELVHSNLRLEHAMSEKEDFLRAVSHDLGAPLRNIAGLAHLLEQKHRSSLGEDGCEKLGRITNNVKHELQLIEQLLEISRIKTQRGRPTKVDLQELITQIRSDFSFFLEERKIKMVFTDALPVIYAEKNRLRQLFQNLIDNAIKYLGDQPEPYIQIGWTKEEKIYLFWVSDNGMGIPADQKDKIFGVFRRVKSKEAANIEGKGVGLALVKSIVEVLGGEIWVESELGKGSTFYFTIDRSLVSGEIPPEPEDSSQEGSSQEEYMALLV